MPYNMPPEKGAIHAHMTHESGLDSVVPIAEAKILFQRKLEELKAPVIYVEGKKRGSLLAF